MNGILIFDKPAGITSHDLVANVRRALNQKKVGHTGTLDPFATGVLPVALGEATKIIPYLDESIKEYRAVMQMGVSTDTQDYTGRIIEQKDTGHITEDLIQEAIRSYIGTISQVPPMFSAVKQGGVPLYKKARLGEEVERAPRQIVIHSFSLDDVQLPLVTFTVSCSRGTYVRTLANDLGVTLGCGAHLVELRRTRSGIFSIVNAIQLGTLRQKSVDDFLTGHLISPLRALSHLPSLTLTEEGAKNVGFGRAPSAGDIETYPTDDILSGQTVCLVRDDKLLAIGSGNDVTKTNQEKIISLLRVFT
ncbi:MAG: tRNA pseudouridine(55) synthase TruB [Deltaproteobacteria bacterium]|nr:tRNA pseudouridine(55) synthase TruB [Deltaproteobacteria bacterium]TLN03780.1 MAG: tRNA pseudouridine(55) synthase TruB [bacterium]